MKMIFIKKECILIYVWEETRLVDEVAKEIICTETLTPDNFLKTDIIHIAFEAKKFLDKRDSFIIIN